jgi:hypothetical protein
VLGERERKLVFELDDAGAKAQALLFEIVALVGHSDHADLDLVF